MSNPIGLHACYFSGTNLGRDIDSIIEAASLIGPDYLELSPAVFLDLTSYEKSELRKKIEDKGMKISCNSGLMNASNNTSSEDPSIRRAGLEHCRRVLSACADMGSPYWSGLMHSPWCLKPDMSDPAGDKMCTWERAVKAMSDISEIARGYGVVCAIEVVNRYEHFLINTAADGVAFLREVGSEYCGLLLDVFHMMIEEDNMGDAIRYAAGADALKCIHVGETNRRIPHGGSTNIDWDAFGTAVRESGFKGNIVLEPLPFATSATAANCCLWRNVQDPDDEARLIEDGKTAVALMRRLTAI